MFALALACVVASVPAFTHVPMDLNRHGALRSAPRLAALEVHRRRHRLVNSGAGTLVVGQPRSVLHVARGTDLLVLGAVRPADLRAAAGTAASPITFLMGL